MLHVFLAYTTPRDRSNAEAEGVVMTTTVEARPDLLALPSHLPS